MLSVEEVKETLRHLIVTIRELYFLVYKQYLQNILKNVLRYYQIICRLLTFSLSFKEQYLEMSIVFLINAGN